MTDDTRKKGEHAEPKDPAVGRDRQKLFAADDELLGRLVRLGVRENEMPDGSAERLKTELRPIWETKVARRRRRLALMYGSGAIAAALLIFFLLSPMIETDPLPPTAILPVEVATVAVSDGVARTGEGHPVRPGRAVRVGDTVATGPSSRLSLSLDQGGSIRLDRETSLRFASSEVVELAEGTIYVDSGPGKSGSLQVRARFGVVREIGTQFEVKNSSEELRVRVRRGMVRLDTEHTGTSLGEGEGATVTPAGVSILPPMEAGSEHWDWIHAVTPPFDIDGKSVSEYLAWVRHETGLEIVTESDELAEELTTILLSGELRGISPEESLAPVLSTAGLEIVRTENDARVIVDASAADR